MLNWKSALLMLLVSLSPAHAEVVTGTGSPSIQLQMATADQAVIQVDDEAVSGIARVPLLRGTGSAWLDVALGYGRKPRVNWGRVEVAMRCSDDSRGADVAYYRVLPNGHERLRAAVHIPMDRCGINDEEDD